ncbi:DUF3108 domain-containing protein [Jeongeupia naejangsanensis]|uniref:DUF3108 domain-containing protein n=1 Tax=Jeongeupia naejangsanensis TaxID=613195 RepID=A0ABS2BK25_9NEIS|nr:DUF3108 domain-containing protein [Jeongeupia naejangsanensis]MBM3115965.1 DUF3108 domain-containing protein [Jeongeupia naejangsanensis]
MTPRFGRRLLGFALALSLLLHLSGLFGELALAWWARPSADATPLRKATQKLAAQELDDETTRPAGLAGVKPADKQVVYLRPLAELMPPKPVAPPPAATPKPASRPKPRPVKVVASAPVATPAVAGAAVGSAVATAAASMPASAPALAAASKPAAAVSTEATRTVHASAPAGLGKQAKAFPKKVEITYVYGVFPVRMTWRVDQGDYRLKLAGSLFGRTRLIESVGTVGKDGVVPQRFSDYKDDKLLNEATFDWDAKTVTLNDKGNLKTADISPGDQDLFSAAFQFALQGAKMKNFTFAMVSGRKLYPEVAFEIRGETTLRLGDQHVDVILLHGEFEDRIFDFWLAPQWNNMPVRIQLTLGKDSSSFDILANAITINGEQVLKPLSSTNGTVDRNNPQLR